MLHRLDLEFASPAARSAVLIGDRHAALGEFFSEARFSQAVIIGDEQVAALYRDELVSELNAARVPHVITLDFVAGEASKRRQTVASLHDQMLAARISRRGAVCIALGGGVSTDIAGFVAATYMRGIPYVNIPTSLLAQVDAAIGGKTGVNTSAGKNLIGAIHQPEAIIIDPQYLVSLPAEHWRNGLAELAKHGVIGDAELFADLQKQALALSDPQALPLPLLLAAVEVKAEIVRADPFEERQRAWLNFGHTIGHAVEQALGYRLLHGQAVAVGMVVEARIAEDHGLPSAAFESIRSLLAELNLPTSPPEELSFEALLPYLRIDKKRSADSLQMQMALPRDIGQMIGDIGRGDIGRGYTVATSVEDARRAWEACRCSV